MVSGSRSPGRDVNPGPPEYEAGVEMLNISLKNIGLKGRQIISLLGAPTSLGSALVSSSLCMRLCSPFCNVNYCGGALHAVCRFELHLANDTPAVTK
jgi:hypothetical protein